MVALFWSPLDTKRSELNIDSKRKQSERASKIATLPKTYLYPLAPEERTILGKPIQELVQDVHKQVTDPIDILRAYGKVALKAQEKTNCVTEILFPEAEEWTKNEINLKGPLAGIPVSLKDSIQVKGFDISLGFSGHTGKPYSDDGPLVKLLKEAGTLGGNLRATRADSTRRNPVRKDQPSHHPSVFRVHK